MMAAAVLEKALAAEREAVRAPPLPALLRGKPLGLFSAGVHPCHTPWAESSTHACIPAPVVTAHLLPVAGGGEGEGGDRRHDVGGGHRGGGSRAARAGSGRAAAPGVQTHANTHVNSPPYRRSLHSVRELTSLLTFAALGATVRLPPPARSRSG